MPSTPRQPPESARAAAGIWRFGEVRYDPRERRLLVRGTAVDPGGKALRVLDVLLAHAGAVVGRDTLAEQVWPRRILSETALTTTISRLRAALGDTDGSAVQTVKGYGYRLIAPVAYDGPEPPPLARLPFRAGDSPPERPDWKLVEALGSGGQGDVWLARDAAGCARVFKFARDLGAIATLRRELEIFRLLEEARGDAAAAGFVPVLDHQWEPSPAFIATPLIVGGNLAQWAARQGGLATVPLMLRLDLVAGIAEALASAHAAGVLHKDLKPANVLVDDETGADALPRVRLADFGSGGVLDRERLRRHAMSRVGHDIGITVTRAPGDSSSGTPLYMAPEVLAGQPSTERSDVYALGLMLYQMVVGDLRRPMAAGWEQDVDDALLREDIGLCAVGNPLHRLGDAGELARRLRSLDTRRIARDREQAEALRAAALERELDRHRQRRPLLVGIGALLVVGIIGLGLLGWRLSQAVTAAGSPAAAIEF